MKGKQTDQSPGHLSNRTVAIVFSLVAIIFITVCLSVGAWPLAVGALIAIPLLPVMFYLLNLLGGVIFGPPIFLLFRLLPIKLGLTPVRERGNPETCPP